MKIRISVDNIRVRIFDDSEKNYCRVECVNQEEALNVLRALNFVKNASVLDGGQELLFSCLINKNKKNEVKIRGDLDIPIKILQDMKYIDSHSTQTILRNLTSNASDWHKKKKKTDTPEDQKQSFFYKQKVSPENRFSELGCDSSVSSPVSSSF